MRVEQVNIFDVMQSSSQIPFPNEEGFISSELLVPFKWECWKYERKDWTLRGGEPYVIEAVLAMLPGNRLYVKDWMLYPFMYELKSSWEVAKKYNAMRSKIVERMAHNDNIQRTWQADEMPQLVDMWKYKDGEYSCEEYAKKIICGYQIGEKGG